MDSMIQCLECKKKCANEAALHRHLKRQHKLSQKTYYTTHYPRFDKLDGTPITFKNREFYMTSDFNSRANLRQWLSQASEQEAQEYIRHFLLMRKEQKHMLFAPCQVELRSLMVPGMFYLNKLFGGGSGYYNECCRLGLRVKYDLMHFSKDVLLHFSPAHKVIIDTREQKPLEFVEIATEHKGLTFGDYQLNDNGFSQNCCIERKAMGDFYNTLSHGYDRFCKEIERAQSAGFYLIVVVEGPMEEVYNYSHHLRALNVVISPEFVLHNMRQICQKYAHVQFLFVTDRHKASSIILTLFRSNGQYRQVDLQYVYDIQELN